MVGQMPKLENLALAQCPVRPGQFKESTQRLHNTLRYYTYSEVGMKFRQGRLKQLVTKAHERLWQLHFRCIFGKCQSANRFPDVLAKQGISRSPFDALIMKFWLLALVLSGIRVLCPALFSSCFVFFHLQYISTKLSFKR